MQAEQCKEHAEGSTTSLLLLYFCFSPALLAVLRVRNVPGMAVWFLLRSADGRAELPIFLGLGWNASVCVCVLGSLSCAGCSLALDCPLLGTMDPWMLGPSRAVPHKQQNPICTHAHSL